MLIGNYTVRNKSPGRFFAGGSTASTNEGQVRSNYSGTAMRAAHYQSGASTANKRWGKPTGGYESLSWMLPYTQGDMVSYQAARGEATATATIRDGRPIAGSSAGVATATATGQLVVSGAGTSAGVATVSGSIYAAILGAGSTAGIGAASGGVTAKGWISGSAAGTSTPEATISATGQLIGSIVPAVDLEAESFSAYLLDEEDVETGLTLRQALRLIAAATAGKVSGASGSTITIRNAYSDSKDRIVATVDSNGNRTGITYDLSP